MTLESLSVYPDRLAGGHVEPLEGEIPPEAVGPEFVGVVGVKGEAYVTGERLVLMLNLTGEVALPCTICNAPVHLPLKMRGYCHVEELADHPHRMIDLAPIVRGILLVEVPPFAECEGECPKRESLEKMKKTENHGFHPFEKL